MKKVQTRVLKVLDRIKEQVSVDVDDAAIYAEALQEMLDKLASHDFFGTEGQCDPRGDQRNGLWLMTRVEGVDPR